jgi:hypothetical protein
LVFECDYDLKNVEYKAVIVLLVAVFLFPLLVVQIIPTDSPEPYVFQVRFNGLLGETMNGKLRYYIVGHVEGISPSPEFVVTIDLDYSRGTSSERIGEGRVLWMQGSLMTHEIYYGEQYLFFDLPQLYISQIKNGVLWPDQLTELRVLYMSPVNSLLSPLQLPLYAFTEEFSLMGLLVLWGKTALVVSTGYLAYKRRHERRFLIKIILAYMLLAIILTVPVLTDLY